MTLRDQSDREVAVAALEGLIESDHAREITPGVSVELAGMLLHLAGGEGRGVYRIVHDPEGDRVA